MASTVLTCEFTIRGLTSSDHPVWKPPSIHSLLISQELLHCGMWVQFLPKKIVFELSFKLHWWRLMLEEGLDMVVCLPHFSLPSFGPSPLLDPSTEAFRVSLHVDKPASLSVLCCQPLNECSLYTLWFNSVTKSFWKTIDIIQSYQNIFFHPRQNHITW